MVLGGSYSLWLYNRLGFGNLKIQYVYSFSDINQREFWTLAPLIFLTIFVGIYPDIILSDLHPTAENILGLVVERLSL